MRAGLNSFARNLFAGARLAVLMPVARLEFRIGIGQLLALFVLSAALDVGVDWIRYGPDALFSWYGAGSELLGGAMLMVTAALIALAFRQPALALAVPVIAMSALPLVQIAQATSGALRHGWPEHAVATYNAENLLLGWIVVVLVRSVAVALAPPRPHRWPRALAGGLLLAAPIWLAPVISSSDAWWRQPALTGEVDPRYPNPASEPVLAAQPKLLDDALGALDDERPGTTDLYFVAFAGYSPEDVFRKDIEAARRVMDERWGTEGRSIALINNPRTLLTAPMATVSNLRETLNEIGAAINPDEDVVMVYLASHGGRDHVLSVELPPLQLAPLAAPGLRTLFDDAGIKWRIVVVSACYAGGFVDALKDDHTIVIAAAQANRTSFGCGHRSDATYFGEAMFQQGMARSDSLLDAFAIAQARIAERELAGGIKPPSNPQLWVGPAMADKLKELDRGNAARRAGRSV